MAAKAAQKVADELGLDGSLARRCGLLHDIGRLILETHLPDEFREVQRLARHSLQVDLELIVAEQGRLGVGHW